MDTCVFGKLMSSPPLPLSSHRKLACQTLLASSIRLLSLKQHAPFLLSCAMTDSLRSYNTFGIDATCRALFHYDSVFQLRLLLRDVVGTQAFLHIGGGSNLLFVQSHYDGYVLHSRIKGIEIVSEDDHELTLRIGAGEVWDEVVAHCVSCGYFGLENLSIIPGEVGASAVQNIGAYGAEVGDYIVQVETLCVKTGEIRVFTAQECQYAYRSSVFKQALKNQYIVTHVHYRLSKVFRPILTHAALRNHLEQMGKDLALCTAQDLRDAVIAVRQSKLPDHTVLGNAGSFFMNPVITTEKGSQLLASYPTMPHYPTAEGIKIPAAWLIEQSGWKGRSHGNVGVHHLQALVLVNRTGQATGAEVADLARLIMEDVYQKFGIQLQPEVLYIP